jgi:hypothetical protein
MVVKTNALRPPLLGDERSLAGLQLCEPPEDRVRFNLPPQIF